jgi:hypothetical protein
VKFPTKLPGTILLQALNVRFNALHYANVTIVKNLDQER